MRFIWCCVVAALLLPAAVAMGRVQDSSANLTGNVERGRTLFNATLKCGACHGSTGESGSPRLIPMKRTQTEFITFVQKPTVNQMPAFGDRPAQDLADVYAYIKSIQERTPPPLQSIPILNDVLKTIP
jgi:mono/diheme cytochrome c family protein